MRTCYKSRRNDLISRLRSWKYADRLEIYEQDAGLHFILRLDTDLSDRTLGEKMAGVSVPCLTDFYHEPGHGDLHCLVVSYGGMEEERVKNLLQALEDIFESHK